jgi:hypothetical protein
VNDDSIAWQAVHDKHDSVASSNQSRKDSPKRSFVFCSEQCPLLPSINLSKVQFAYPTAVPSRVHASKHRTPEPIVNAYVTHPFFAQILLPSNDQLLSYIMGAAVDQKIISKICDTQLVHLKCASIGPVRWWPAVSGGRVGRRGSEDRVEGPR